MNYSILAFFIFFFAVTSYCQTEDAVTKFNLDFETVESDSLVGWEIYGGSNYSIILDSTEQISGKYSALIKFNEGNPNYKTLSFTLLDNYAGKKITLSGYIKTENVTDGYAGLWMRIDPSIAFDNMYKNGVKGTTDWTKYEITLKMSPEKTQQIVIGGLLVGKGKMWLDNFTVSIDGKDINNLTPLVRELLPADKDKDFDNGSGINISSVSKDQMDNLKDLGLIWGFLKYYHPNIAKGQYNWDYELFRILPKVLNSEDKNTCDSLFISWIKSLGQFSKGKEKAIKASDVKIKPDLDWIENSDFSDELTTILLQIKNAKKPTVHYYIGLRFLVGNPEFKHENAYSSITYPDAGFRLLSLYRYWNIIQYYFPYKNLIEEDWNSLLEEFIPKFIAARDETEYTLAVLELIGRVHDTHANVWGGNQVLNNYFGLRYAAAEISFIEGKPVVTGFYDEKFGKESGLEIGDIISVINNQPVEDIIAEKMKYAPASNYPTKLRNISFDLLRTNDSIINIEYIRNGKVENKTLETFSYEEINVYSKYEYSDTCFKLINEDIAFINNGSLKKEYLPDIWKDIQNTKGLIIDIRNYPSDFPLYQLSCYLMPKKTQFVKFTKGSIKTPGLFTYTKPIYTGKKNKNYYQGKVIILINEITQSSAEFHAMAYRVNPNSIVIGSKTAGADGNVSRFDLPGGIITMISGIGVYYPDGQETQRIGIVPDIEIEPTIQGIKEGRDELLEKAISLIYEK